MFEFKVDDQISLRMFEPRHTNALFALTDTNRRHLRQWVPWLDTVVAATDTLNFIVSTQKQFADNNGFITGIWYQGELAGVLGHNRIDWINRLSEVGYWIGDGFQGRGVVTRSCRALVTHAFTEMHLNRIEIRCAEGNSRSRAIPERLGFRQEGIIRQAEWLYDKFVDLVVYGMVASEWQSK